MNAKLLTLNLKARRGVARYANLARHCAFRDGSDDPGLAARKLTFYARFRSLILKVKQS